MINNNTREIKFRVWDVNKEEMKILDNLALPIDSKNEFQILMQYTGLKDRNGKEVFEGDILIHKGKSPKTLFLEVIWKDYKWGFKSVEGTGGHPMVQLFRFPQNFEIIGNVYENL